MNVAQLLRSAVTLAQSGRFDEAAAYLERGLATDPNLAEPWAMLGALRNELGEPEAALLAFEKALKLQPDVAATHVNRGAALTMLERHGEAAEAYARAAALSPRLAMAHNNLAQALNELERHEEAIESAQTAIGLREKYASAYGNLGSALYSLGRYEEALEAFQAGQAAANNVAALCNLGMALTALGRYPEAEARLTEAVNRDADLALARYRRAIVRLTLRDFERGWPDLESRWETPLFTSRSSGRVTAPLRERLVKAPNRGDFAGKSVLVVAEQGVGDEIMFASCLPDLAAEAARVAVVCDPRLVRLFRASFPSVDVLAPDAPDPAGFDRIVAIGSLAHAYRRKAADFTGAPYLKPTAEARARWAERLGPAEGRRRIGVSWKGGLKRTGASGRSMPLQTLGPLITRPNVEIVSLQYGDVAAEVDAVNVRIPRAIRRFEPAEISDFDDLAGLVANLDLVVTVQTAIVHLAGAIGAPAWVLVPKKPEWRYGATGADIPWYRSVKLYRQGPAENWGQVLNRVLAAL